MKKKIFRFAFVLGIIVSLASCLSSDYAHKMVVDENVPADQNVTVTFMSNARNGWFEIKEWNNKNIKDGLYGETGSDFGITAVLTVPAGNTSFTFNVNFSFSTFTGIKTYQLKNIELNYDLELGKKYEISGTSKPLDSRNGNEFFVGIYDVTNDKTLLKEWKLGETE